MNDKPGYFFCRPELERLPQTGLPVYIRSTGFVEEKRDEHENAPPGSKNFVQIFWMISGSGEVELDGRRLPAVPGDFFHRMPGEAHVLHTATRPWVYRWLTFDGPGAEAFMRAYGYPREPFHAGNCPHELFMEFRTLLQERTPYSLRRGVAVVADILARAGGRPDGETGEGKILRDFLRLCQNRYMDPTANVGVLADELEISRATLSRLFARRMLTSPGRYLTQIRMQHAMNLLHATEHPIAEVAKRAGFADFSYFCKTIRAHTGCTPREYRSGLGRRGGI